jgi:hypothetical protein
VDGLSVETVLSPAAKATGNLLSLWESQSQAVAEIDMDEHCIYNEGVKELQEIMKIGEGSPGAMKMLQDGMRVLRAQVAKQMSSKQKKRALFDGSDEESTLKMGAVNEDRARASRRFKSGYEARK